MIHNNNPLAFLKAVKYSSTNSQIHPKTTPATDFTPPNYMLPDQDQDDREAAEIRAAHEMLGG